MPHISYASTKALSTPSTYDGVEFLHHATSDNDEKIITRHKQKDFLLSLHTRKDTTTLKADKITRVTPVSIIQEAISSYTKALDAHIVFSNIKQELSKKVTPHDRYLKPIEYFVDEFQTDKEIWVEIGFGSGRHLLHQAKKHPHIVFIGLEIHTPSIEQMLKHVKLEKIENILAINYDARLFLEFLNSNSVGKIFVHFPVPWDKKPHRRVLGKDFIAESLRVLKKDGTLELRTDSRNYFEYSLDLLTHLDFGRITIDINKNLEISSKYEDRWKKMGKNIYDLTLVSTQDDPPHSITKDFTFDSVSDFSSIQKKLKLRTPLVFDDFIINFTRLYTISDNHGLIQLTFGAFNAPVSKYIEIKNNHCAYFQGAPLPTSTNLKAHQKISEILTHD